jgi:DnaJ-class molecular chaperone
MPSSSYYDTLGVESSASASEIRKAYLKLSLKHHPDKNPENVEAAKAKFVVIGQAYETLKDPEARAVYDRELRSGGAGFSSSSNGNSNNSVPNTTPFDFDSQAYDNYRDAFDSTVAGMSEADLAAAVGAAAVVGSLVGSLIGSRMLSGGGGGNRGAAASGKRSAGSGILSAAGSLMGSMVAKEMATSSVRALHQQSVQRLAYKEECRRAVERGDPIPDPPSSSKWDQVLQKTVETVKGVMQAATDGNNNKTGRTSFQ